MKFVFLFLVCLGTSLMVNAQDKWNTKLDKMLDSIADNNQNMGSLAIAKDGKVVYAKAIGYANTSKKSKADVSTLYRIGSISKTYTAAIIMQLVQEGKIRLDEPLSTWFDEFEYATQITISDLLRHRSGLYNFTDDPQYLDFNQIPHDRAMLLQKMTNHHNDKAPGKSFEYSNTNYVLLSFIIEDVTGKKIEEVFDQRITQGLNLPNTYIGIASKKRSHEAASYTYTSDWVLETETDMSVPLGAGAVVSTASEVALFLDKLSTGKVVSEASLHQMEEMVDGYGFGLFEFPFYDKKAKGHTGGIDGFHSSAGYFAKDGYTIAYLCNGMVMEVNEIMIGALSHLFDKPYSLPDMTPGLIFSDDFLAKYDGVFAAANFPLKVTISHDDGVMIGQATGQPSFPLKAISNQVFVFDAAGLKLTFTEDGKSMQLEQSNMKWTLTKE